MPPAASKTTALTGGERQRQKSKRSRARMAVEAKRLKAEGLTNLDIAARLGCNKNLVQALVGKTRHRANDFAAEPWAEFIASLVTPDEDELFRVNGRRLNDRFERQFRRWSDSDTGTAPNLFSADDFLTFVGIHLDTWFHWCDERGYNPWATGIEPEWHRLPVEWPDDSEQPVEVSAAEETLSEGELHELMAA
jgi:hypothetical protein